MKSYIVEYSKEEALRLKDYAERKGYKCGKLIEEVVKMRKTTKIRYTIECEEN